MMTKDALVVAILPDGRAKVSVKRESACGHDCANCKGCVTLPVPIEAVVENTLHVKKGDVVRIETGSGKILKLAALSYLLPVLLLILGYALLGGRSEFLGMVGGFVGLAAGFGLWLVWNKRLDKSQSVIFQMTEILKER